MEGYRERGVCLSDLEAPAPGRREAAIGVGQGRGGRSWREVMTNTTCTEGVNLWVGPVAGRSNRDNTTEEQMLSCPPGALLGEKEI